MAIFKILKGPASRVSMEATPYTEGYAYFTPEDGGFYIDAEVDGEARRVRVNPRGGGAESRALTLSAQNWTRDAAQRIAVPGVTADSTGVIGIAQSASAAQRNAAKTAQLRLSAQEDGYITITAEGGVPAVDIPLICAVFV